MVVVTIQCSFWRCKGGSCDRVVTTWLMWMHMYIRLYYYLCVKEQ